MADAPKQVLEEVSKEYEASLVVPETKSDVQWLLMPVGLIGSGKTTIVKKLADRFGLLRVSTDEVREILKRRGYSFEGCRDIAQDLAKKYLRLGYSLAIDANTGSKYGLEYNKKTQEEFPGVRQLFVYVNPPHDYVIEKLRNYKHTWLFENAQEAVTAFNKNKAEFSKPDLPFVYEFDTSREDLGDQIEEAEGAIKKALS